MDLNVFLAPPAHVFFVAALIIAGTGAGVALYERFTVPSRRFLVLTAVTGTWIACLGLAGAAGDPAASERWLRLAFMADPFSAPALYWLATAIEGTPRRRVQLGLWVVAASLAGVSAAGPWVVRGLETAARDFTLTGYGWLGALYLTWIVGVLAAGVSLLIRSGYAAVTRELRLESRLLSILGLLASLNLVDYWLPTRDFRVGLVTPVSIGLAALLAAVVASRYRVFALSQSFGTEEVLRALSEAVLVCDDQGRIRGSNVAAQRLLNRSGGRLVGRPIAEVLATVEEGIPWRAEHGRAVRDEDGFLLVEGGQRIPAAVSTEPLIRGGRVVGSVVVARDVREHREAQRALEEAERRFRALFEYNPGIVYEIEATGTLVTLNPAGEELLGESLEALRGRPFIELIAEEDRPSALETFEHVLSGFPGVYELGLKRGDGGRRRIRGLSVPVQNGGEVQGVLGVALDVTTETRAKQSLEVQRRYYAELFEASPEAVALVGADGVVRRVNSEFGRLFGYAREEVVGRRLDDLIVPEDRKAEGEDLTRLALTGGVARAETVRRRREGGLVDVSLLAREVRIPGEPPQMYAVYRDITEWRAAERRLREREEELRHAQKLEAVGKLAGGIAHDFNNLLTVINGHARFLLDRLGEGESWRGDLEEIERAGARAATLTQQLLAFSRRQVLRPQVLDLNTVIRDLERMLARLIGEHIQLVTRLGAGTAAVHADRGQLEQVVVNLVVNARDAMPAGGIVTIGTDTVRLREGGPEATRWGVEPGTYVRLLVTDTGTGMEAGTMERIFEPFFTTKERGKGTGLGLATVFGIVKQTGGHVTAESVPGSGSTFCVLLPLAAAAFDDGAGDPADRPSVGKVASRRILVVEDEAAVRSLTARVLERAGHTVMQAANGLEALALLDERADEVDLVLTDLVMPEMGGRELRAALRRRYPRIPVVFMSGYDEDRALAEGEDGVQFLPKPFTPAALVDVVARALAVPAA